MKKLVEKRLEELIPPLQKPLLDVVSYSLLSPGKRLRPLTLLHLTTEKSDPSRYDCACAIEMLHASSLVHDDLPSMDDDDYRRGRASTHKVYGEAQAILAADFLMSLPYQVLAQNSDLTTAQKCALIQTLSSHFNEVVEGQSLDLTRNSSSWDEIEQIHLKKTAALYVACFEFAAILNQEPLEKYTEMGKKFGLAYQLLDDLIDDDVDYLPLNEVESMAVKLFDEVATRFPSLHEMCHLLLSKVCAS
ncbi:MAG: Farnesyl diphosphate synthase [Chlamydiia bacterium]|nr:Farnesyl diphosphate synthase [Chlamydiia bacterium]MCH9615788.1 Farnesyl diphosphate synthase [Chlamydiia bacterium]MCH9628809.1 Farnesyl diphosphate synthase [Chlamydiia bacterium]